MKHVSTPAFFLKYTRRGVLLLALGVAGPAAWGQSFGPVVQYSAGAGSFPTAAAVGDVNGDGLPDIVTANASNATAGVLLGVAGGGFAPISTYATGPGSNPNGVQLGDLNGDGRLDIATANSDSDDVGVLLGQASGGFAPVRTYATGPGSRPIDVRLADVDGDGRLDLVTANQATNGVGILLGQANGFAPVSTYATGAGSLPLAVAVGDVNGDGRPDIVMANAGTNTAGVLLGQAGGFAAVVTYAVGTFGLPEGVALGDVNGDGRPDIVVANPNSNNIGVLLGQAGGFAAVSLYTTGMGSYPRSVVLGDVNGDARPDIITANTGTRTAGVLLGQVGGAFGQVTAYSTGALTQPVDAVVGDMNRDGRPDIVAVNSNLSTVGVLLNTGTYLATAQPTAADFTLAPNPVHDAFTVQLPAGLAPSSAELLNALGQVVRRPAVGAGSFQVETSGLVPGIYTLRLRAGSAALARRVVVE